MAKLNNLFLLILFLLATAIMRVPAHKGEIVGDIETDPVVEDKFAFPPGTEGDEGFDDEPELSPKQLKYLQDCAKKMTPECAKEVFAYMFEDMVVTDQCCELLIKMGEPCHLGLVKTIMVIPEYKANASYAIPRSKQVWNKCAALVGAHSPSPIPLEI
ncbi:hypothetical protein COLO4_10003 [Corchorus olitorius]|uniref:Prolamin-like domain-containing protein n=1 Tax=Corchorus olitorius TaxID=93759 RepID=A0A1R3KAA1_9ROSI|nr:hypothetical protein COLO4_10003 [Corchorus olitorius]